MPSSANTNMPNNGQRAILAIRGFSFVALTISAYLSWITVTHGTVAACGESASYIGCDHVLRSAWSRWLGMPVSIFGCVTYLSVLVTSYWKTPNVGEQYAAIADRIFVGLITMAATSAVWFLSLQVFVIGKFCLFCVSIHFCGIAIASLHITSRLRQQHRKAAYATILQHAAIGDSATPSATLQGSEQETSWPLLPHAVAFLGILLLVGGQVFFPAKTFEVSDGAEFVDVEMGDTMSSLNSGAPVTSTTTTTPMSATGPSSPDNRVNADAEPEYSPPVSPEESAFAKESGSDAESEKVLSRQISLLNDKFKIDVYRHGLLGSSEAEHVIVELVDYTCKDCRQLHQQFKQVRRQFGDRLAIVVLPVPLETSCNPHLKRTHPSHVGACKYVRLALAVLEVDRRAFVEFHDWLMESQYPPSIQDAKSKATQLVDANQLELAINGDRVRKRLKAHLRLFSRVGRFPAMFIGDHAVVGVPSSAADLGRVLKNQLGIKDLDS